MSNNTITTNKDASLKVSGDVDVLDADGNVIKSAKDGDVWLCRCGHSKQKPFCDGSHREAGFSDEE